MAKLVRPSDLLKGQPKSPPGGGGMHIMPFPYGASPPPKSPPKASKPPGGGGGGGGMHIMPFPYGGASPPPKSPLKASKPPGAPPKVLPPKNAPQAKPLPEVNSMPQGSRGQRRGS